MRETRSNTAILDLLKTNADKILWGSRGILGQQDWHLKAKSIFVSSTLDICTKMGLQLSELSVVDIGCSRCDILPALRELGCEDLFGVNLTAFNFQWLRDPAEFDEYWGDSPGKIRYLVCDVHSETLPFEDRSESIIFVCDVLEHLHNPLNILSESARVLNKDGLLAIGTPNGANLKNRLRLLTGKSAYCNLDSWLKRDRIGARFVGHIREYSMQEVDYLLSLYEFRVLPKRFIPSNSEGRKGMIYQIYKGLERLYPPFSYHMLLVGQK